METADASDEDDVWSPKKQQQQPPPKRKKRSVRVNPCLVLLNALFACVGLGFVGIGLWLSFNHSTNCIHFLQTVLIGSGLFMVLVAATGLVGAIWSILWLLYLNFMVMLLLLLIVVGTTVFVLVVTSHGISASVRPDSNGKADPFSNWLRHQVDERMRSCTQNGQICEFVRYTYANGYYSRPRLSALQVACCEPPAGCDVGGNYNSGNNTASAAAQADCEAWRKAGVTTGFCSRCSLCQAAVAENIRHIWHRIALFKVIALLVLVPAYFITCCYFKQDDDAPGAASTNYQRCLDCCFNVL